MSLPVQRISFGSRTRRAAPKALVSLIFGFGLLGLAAASHAVEMPVVRVLLERGVASIRVTPRGGAPIKITSRGTSLRVGGKSVGSVWESPSASLHSVQRAGGTDWVIPGRVRIRNAESGLVVVAFVPLEAYVEGTVGREMPTSWEPAALRAQAIVSRTYGLRALREPKDPLYDVEVTTASQVFGGNAAIVPSVRRAVAETRGQYLAYRGAPILAVFHSASGGKTAGAEEVWGRELPYLRSLEVPDEEEAPSTYWRAAVARTTLRLALRELGLDVGPLTQIEVSERWPSGRVKWITVAGPGGERRFSGRLLRESLGPNVVKSTLFEVRERGEDIVFVGSGHGHGVGMSQWGAKAMASRGAGHREILAAFYPGSTLEMDAGRLATSAVASGREN